MVNIYTRVALSRRSRILRVVDRGLQLRLAAEKGKVQEVKRLLAVGAPVTTDAVSNLLTLVLFANSACI